MNLRHLPALAALCRSKPTIRGVLTAAQMAALVMFLVGCATSPQPVQVSIGLLGTYDAAVGVEEGILTAGHPTPAQATKLRAARLKAWSAVQAVVAAEKAGGNTAGAQAAAQAALTEFAAANATTKGN